MHIRTYGVTSKVSVILRICTYSLEIHAHTAPVKPTYGSYEVIYVHMRAIYVHIYVRITYGMSVYYTVCAVYCTYMHV